METKTEEKKPELALVPTATAGDLAPSADAPRIVWTKERADLVKRQICPAGITDDEFAVFLEQCKRTELDPLIGEAFCVPRSVKIMVPDGRGGTFEKKVIKHVFQAAESGMAARCDRFPDFRGIKAGAVYANDTIEIDQEAGTVKHRFNPIGDRGPLIGAWARVYRENRHTPIEWVLLADYIQKNYDGKPTGQWGTKKETMIVKCARAAAERRAFPNTFGGIYDDAELPDPEEREINPAPATPEQEANGGKTRTQTVAEKVQAKVASTPATSTTPAPGTAAAAAPPKPSQQVVDAKPAPGEATAVFGGPGIKGRKLKEISLEELVQLEAVGKESIAKTPSAPWVPKVKENVEQIGAELARREPPAPKPAEPVAGFDPVLPDAERGPAEEEVPF